MIVFEAPARKLDYVNEFAVTNQIRYTSNNIHQYFLFRVMVSFSKFNSIMRILRKGRIFLKKSAQSVETLRIMTLPYGSGHNSIFGLLLS